MVARDAVDELGSDPDAVARFTDTSFKNVTDAYGFGDVLHVERLTLERKGGVSGDDRQRRNVREISDDVFADPIAEIFLFAAHRSC